MIVRGLPRSFGVFRPVGLALVIVFALFLKSCVLLGFRHSLLTGCQRASFIAGLRLCLKNVEARALRVFYIGCSGISVVSGVSNSRLKTPVA